MNINTLITELESYFDRLDLVNTKVSKSSIAWHIDHILLVNNNVCKELIKSDPNNYKWQFNLTKSLILTSNYIPRGKARAPKGVVSDSYDKAKLIEGIVEARSLLKRIESLDNNTNFNHPIFGLLNLKTTQRFLFVHAFHHLKIIRDIASK